jgi:hypothetical protein
MTPVRFSRIFQKSFCDHTKVNTDIPLITESASFCQRPGIISNRNPLKYSVSGRVGTTG